jgi:quercetin dioxygenase-like cupin family protein
MSRFMGFAAMLVVALVGCGNVAEEAPPAAPSEVEPVADIAAAAPEAVSVVLENEWARVMRFTLEPGAELPRHDASERAVYALSDYTIEWTEGDEAPVEKSWTAGQAHWHAGGPHSVLNTGSSVAQFLVFERRGAALPGEEQATDEAEAAQSSPEHVQTLLDNEAVRVAEVTLEAGQSTGRHQGGYRVIYALSDYTIRWAEGDADPVEVSWTEGQAHWHQPAEHEVDNTGDSTARYLVVTFMR